jgi:DNA primase
MSDRFHVWEAQQNYWCRQCGKKGFLDELTGEADQWDEMSDEEKRLIAIERRQAEMERRQEEQEQRIRALEYMRQCTDHLTYRNNLDGGAVRYWKSEGITDASIDAFVLGYCSHCPSDKWGRSSYTIPIFENNALVNISHRIAGATKDKYRPHRAGLGSHLFNSDILGNNPDMVLILEGEKKTIHGVQLGYSAVGVMGQHKWKPRWFDWFNKSQDIVIALDPDAQMSAYKLAQEFFKRGFSPRVASLPAKFDDCVVKYGATPNDMSAMIDNASPVRYTNVF